MTEKLREAAEAYRAHLGTCKCCRSDYVCYKAHILLQALGTAQGNLVLASIAQPKGGKQ